MDRRIFLLGGSAAFAAPPSERIRVALIGAGGRGRYLAQVFEKDPAVEVSAVCDIYEPNLEKGLSELGNRPKAYRNFRQVLEDKNIDAVIIATPEHWHHRMTLDALAAGKDIYVEKPMCHTAEQGAEMVRAVEASDRIVQVGMQRRSYDLFRKARDVRADGTLGNVHMVRSWWLNNNVGPRTERKLEGPLDWDQWQGPAVRGPVNPHRFFNWRFYSDYAGGIVADQGAHVFDGIHLVMGLGFPSAVNASAGRIHAPGVDTPESVVVAAEYTEDDFLAIFTINYAAMKYYYRNDQLNQFDGDQARLDVGREEYSVYRQGAEDKPAIREVSPFAFSHASEVHVDNFLRCVRSRQQPTGTVKFGFQAALVVIMANESLRTGGRVRWNPEQMSMEM